MPSTGRQLQLARLIGRVSPPRFLHHALVMKSVGYRESGRSRQSTVLTKKLSKSAGDTGVRDLRARGWTAARVIGHACALAGLIPAARDVAADEVSSMMGEFTEDLT